MDTKKIKFILDSDIKDLANLILGQIIFYVFYFVISILYFRRKAPKGYKKINSLNYRLKSGDILFSIASGEEFLNVDKDSNLKNLTIKEIWLCGRYKELMVAFFATPLPRFKTKKPYPYGY